ncbi:MAG: PQQ-binding-like beta-propeller repeat protein [Acidobacteriota bacterium]|nr:PQQ-binding-like beta-propeller repeat protein [Acidobacteriota bacterium]
MWGTARMSMVYVRGRYAVLALLIGFVAGAAGAESGEQGRSAHGEWRHHGGDHASSRYSPLAQIDGSNFDRLEIAWRWRSADHEVPLDVLPGYDTGFYRSVPLMIGGRLFAPTSLGQVALLDPATGEQKWVYNPRTWERGGTTMRPVGARGIEYWSDGEKERLFVATIGRQLVSIDAATGLADRAFGEDGVVDLAQDLGPGDYAIRHVTHGAPPIVVGNSVIVGSKIFDYSIRSDAPPGHVRAYDVHTGEFKWRFNTIPRDDEYGVETWENGSWRTAGNANVWASMSADHELGYVYLPTSTPSNDYYGADRPGDNLFAESLVCVDAETGERVWHFQTVRHGIWDYDIASAPNLLDIIVDGKLIKAVAQVSKTGFTYVFDRATGEPVWPIEDRPVNHQSTVPGEKLAETQPFPTKPPAFERQGVSEDDLIDWTPELREEALEIAEKLVLAPMFPPLIVGGEGGKEGVVVVPGAAGGANHPGASVDPMTGVLFVESQHRPTGMSLIEPDAARRPDWRYVIAYVSTGGPQGLPLTKPPYRTITAIDLNRGEHLWQVPVGPGPKNHPAIAHLNLPDMGTSYIGMPADGGLLVTRTLLIGFLALRDEDEPRTSSGGLLRAYDKATGEVVAEIETDVWLHGPPMTYMHEGRQYIVIAGGGARNRRIPDELIAFALPESLTDA